MSIMRPLTPLEIDTIRVALALLLHTPAKSIDLLDARVDTEVATIANDEGIAQLLDELYGAAEVGLRRAAPARVTPFRERRPDRF